MYSDKTDTAEIPLLRHYEDQRTLPRVEIRLPVLLTIENQEIVRGMVRNISPDGLQLRCSPSEAARLRPSGKAIADDDAPSVLIRLSLPLRAGQTSFSSLTQLVYMTTRSDEEIAFGVKFVKLAEQHQATLNRFIFESMEHA